MSKSQAPPRPDGGWHVTCGQCGHTAGPYDTWKGYRTAEALHKRRHDREAGPGTEADLPSPEWVLQARETATRRCLEIALARAGMWLANPELDKAPNAQVVLEEVADILRQAPPPACGWQRRHPLASLIPIRSTR